MPVPLPVAMIWNGYVPGLIPVVGMAKLIVIPVPDAFVTVVTIWPGVPGRPAVERLGETERAGEYVKVNEPLAPRPIPMFVNVDEITIGVEIAPPIVSGTTTLFVPRSASVALNVNEYVPAAKVAGICTEA